jgi:hypothetical protein
MRDQYAESGPWDQVMEKYGLNADSIAREVTRAVSRKNAGP